MLTIIRPILSLCAAITVASALDAHAETKLAGRLEALTPCKLKPISNQTGAACATVIVPIGGTVTITSDSGTTKRVRVNVQGIFATRLNPGDYTIKLRSASVFGTPIDSEDLRLSEGRLTVGTTSFRVHFGVAHKDYFPHIHGATSPR